MRELTSKLTEVRVNFFDGMIPQIRQMISPCSRRSSTRSCLPVKFSYILAIVKYSAFALDKSCYILLELDALIGSYVVYSLFWVYILRIFNRSKGENF